mgnify:CR=1 FL=1
MSMRVGARRHPLEQLEMRVQFDSMCALRVAPHRLYKFGKGGQHGPIDQRDDATDVFEFLVPLEDW